MESPIQNKVAKIIIPLIIICILIGMNTNPFIHRMGAGLAVLSGIILSLIFGNPYVETTKKIASKLLSWSVIGLGFGMNLITVAQVGLHGISYTIISILFCIIVGIILGKFFKTQRNTSTLITIGTAICGGSAIAAVGPTIKAKHHEMSLSLAIVFALNAISLFIFPFIGHSLSLTQNEFGLWSALAIHDTSSVVGATLQYGTQALDVGTTVKLARALWIVPVTLIVAQVYARYFFYKENFSEGGGKIKKPWFILWFLVAAALVTWIPTLKGPGLIIRDIAEQSLIVTLYCIGTNISWTAIKSVGAKAFMQGLLLWIIMASVSLFAVYFKVISL